MCSVHASTSILSSQVLVVLGPYDAGLRSSEIVSSHQSQGADILPKSGVSHCPQSDRWPNAKHAMMQHSACCRSCKPRAVLRKVVAEHAYQTCDHRRLRGCRLRDRLAAVLHVNPCHLSQYKRLMQHIWISIIDVSD